MSAPTQTRRPWRATFRTFVQQVVGWTVAAGVILPLVLAAAQEELGDLIPPQAMGWLVAIVGAAIAVSTFTAKVMAIPAVDRWLSDHPTTRILAADPPPRRGFLNDIELAPFDDDGEG